MVRVEDMVKQMKRRFDANDAYAKVLRGYLSNIEKKVDAHAISIKHLEFQMAHFLLL